MGFLCSRMCMVDGDCKGDGSLCLDLEGNLFGKCTAPCDPVAQTGCGSGAKCNLLPARGTQGFGPRA